MEEILGRISEFIWAVLVHWYALVGGALLGIASVIDAAISPKNRRTLNAIWSKRSRDALLPKLAVLCFLVSAYLAFDDLNTRYRSSQSQVGILIGKLEASSKRDRGMIRTKLHEFYVEAEPLWKGGGITKSSSKEDYQKYLQRISDWKNKTRRWLDANVGKAAGSRFEDFTIEQTPSNQTTYFHAISQDHNWRMNYVALLRKNLTEMIEKDAWDKP